LLRNALCNIILGLLFVARIQFDRILLRLSQSPPKGWPSNGEVEFRQVAMRYRPGLPLVLRGVSFKALAQEKVREAGGSRGDKGGLWLTHDVHVFLMSRL
jgi:ABC-type multidrug transport system fused ATPase/permease subunit